jgi:thiamine-phosphate pyrophosphorylase
MKPFDPTLYLVTDRGLSAGRSNAEVVRRALAGGATMVQYREKAAPVRSLAGEAAGLLSLCRAAGVPLIVNDHLEVAREVGADGVHLGQSDLDPARARALMGEGFIIGVSVRSPGEARAAEARGADYLAANGVFPTASKSGLGVPLGIDGLRRIVEATALPVVAIGGITPSNAFAVTRAGAAGVAVISAVTGAGDIESACTSMLAAIAFGKR